MEGDETLLITSTTGIIVYVSQNKQLENLSKYILHN